MRKTGLRRLYKGLLNARRCIPLGDAINGGIVTFHLLSDAKSKVMLKLEYDPQGFVENVGDVLGNVGDVLEVVSLRVQGDLERFKKFIEKRSRETGAWRGQV